MAHVLETSFRLMHPLMPYITEELWQRSPRPSSRRSSIAFGPYPTKDDARADDEALKAMDVFKAIVSAARSIRSEHDVKPSADAPIEIRSDSEAARAFAEAHLATLGFLAKSKTPTVTKPGGPRAPGSTMAVVPSAYGPIEVLVGLKGLVTKDEELKRIDREQKRIEKDLSAIEKKMSSKAFLEKAPKEVVDEAHAQKKQLEEARTRLDEARKLADEL